MISAMWMVEKMPPRDRGKLNREDVLRVIRDECRPQTIREGPWKTTKPRTILVDEFIRLGLKPSKVEWALRRLELDGAIKRVGPGEIVVDDMVVPDYHIPCRPRASEKCPELCLQPINEKDAYAEKKPRFSKRLGRRMW